MNTFETNLTHILYPNDNELSKRQLAYKKRCATMGIGWYGLSRKMLEPYWYAWDGVVCRDNGCYRKRSPEDFYSFCIEVGEIPKGMKIPTIGRVNHSIGYAPGNFAWQEMSDNSREVFTRCILSTGRKYSGGRPKRVVSSTG